MGRPKSTKQPKATIVRTISVPQKEFHEWETFRVNCENLGVSMSGVLMRKVKDTNKSLEKAKAEQIRKREQQNVES